MMLANRWFPVSTFGDLQREMDRWFGTRCGNGHQNRPSVYPAVNVWEDGDSFFVEAEIPGVKMEDLEVQVVGDELTIKGQRQASEDENTAFHRQERNVGEFARVVTLPADVNPDGIEAVLRDGVLTITLPKAEAVKARKINITNQ
jgi:HSP20 family protein